MLRISCCCCDCCGCDDAEVATTRNGNEVGRRADGRARVGACWRKVAGHESTSIPLTISALESVLCEHVQCCGYDMFSAVDTLSCL